MAVAIAAVELSARIARSRPDRRVDRGLLGHDVMRSISVASCLTALAAISLASACKSDEARSADQQQPSTTTQSDQSAASPAGVAQHRPALPVPRRMRSSQPEAAAGGDQDGDPGSAAGDREERREEMPTAMAS